MKVKIKDIVSADEAIFRWSNLQVPAAMSMTLGLVVRAIRPVLDQHSTEVQKLNTQLSDYVAELRQEYAISDKSLLPPEGALKLSKRKHELDQEMLDLEKVEQTLDGISPIKLSKFKKARIVPSGRELGLAWWLVEMDCEPEDFEFIEEAKSLKTGAAAG